jgi:tetratricopeptide (TPR) repeat protein
MAPSTPPLRAGIRDVAALLAAALIFCLPALGQHIVNVITIGGEVRTADGQPVTRGLMASLSTQRGSFIGTRPVDTRGTFEFDGLSAGVYELTITGEGFETYRQTVDISLGVPSYVKLNVTMTPAQDRKVPAEDLPALTDEAAPKAARKEFEQGADAMKKRNMKKARVHLEKAIELYPCYARAQAALADVEVAGHNASDAETALKKAIQCDGTFMNPYTMLAQLYISEKKYNDGESVLMQGLRVAPSSWPLHYQMGRAHFAMENYSEAAKDFEAAESLHAEMPADFHAQLANTYLQINQYGKALAEIETYLRMDPKGRFAASARRTSQILQSHGVKPATAEASNPASNQP